MEGKDWRVVTGYDGCEMCGTIVREGREWSDFGDWREVGTELNNCCCSWFSGGGKYGGCKFEAKTADLDVDGNIKHDEGLAPKRS